MSAVDLARHRMGFPFRTQTDKNVHDAILELDARLAAIEARMTQDDAAAKMLLEEMRAQRD